GSSYGPPGQDRHEGGVAQAHGGGGPTVPVHAPHGLGGTKARVFLRRDIAALFGDDHGTSGFREDLGGHRSGGPRTDHQHIGVEFEVTFVVAAFQNGYGFGHGTGASHDTSGEGLGEHDRLVTWVQHP